MDKVSRETEGSHGGENKLSQEALEKYQVLSAKYESDFYNYVGYMLMESGREGWIKLIEGIPLETVDAAVSTWIICGRPGKPGKQGSEG